jgi:hypothetical protein
MLRRVVALLLIASSGWLLFQVANDYLGGIDYILSERLAQQLGQPRFLLPAIGGALGLFGGLIIFFGGPGGAAIAMIGGVAVAGFAMSVREQLNISRFWENELGVGVTILVLAGVTAIMGRN